MIIRNLLRRRYRIGRLCYVWTISSLSCNDDGSVSVGANNKSLPSVHQNKMHLERLCAAAYVYYTNIFPSHYYIQVRCNALIFPENMFTYERSSRNITFV